MNGGELAALEKQATSFVFCQSLSTIYKA